VKLEAGVRKGKSYKLFFLKRKEVPLGTPTNV